MSDSEEKEVAEEYYILHWSIHGQMYKMSGLIYVFSEKFSEEYISTKPGKVGFKDKGKDMWNRLKHLERMSADLELGYPSANVHTATPKFPIKVLGVYEIDPH